MIDKVKIIAEIGNTHEGSVGLAKQFIHSASLCGVDAVKFQVHIFEAESLPDAPNPPYFKDESRKAYFDRTGFTANQWRDLKRYAEEECHVGFICSPFSTEAVDMMKAIDLSAYKIASGEVTNVQLLESIAQTGRPVFLSSGMSRWQELDCAVKTLLSNGCHDLTVLQCTSDYPCLPENAGLNLLQAYKERYDLPVGFSDHTIGTAVPVAAVCLGATIIEKHFTLSKAMYGPDAKFSATPEEMQILVRNIREVEIAIRHKIDKDEKAKLLKEMKFTFEKSIVAKRDIPKGTIITKDHLTCKKPSRGIPAQQFYDIIGKKLNCDVAENTCLKWEWIE
jgi:N,N'-diacetyllegionaminate synthase